MESGPGEDEVDEEKVVNVRALNMLNCCRSVDEFERLNRIDEGAYGEGAGGGGLEALASLASEETTRHACESVCQFPRDWWWLFRVEQNRVRPQTRVLRFSCDVCLCWTKCHQRT